jgi:hypothetical protein
MFLPEVLLVLLRTLVLVVVVRPGVGLCKPKRYGTKEESEKKQMDSSHSQWLHR